MEPSRPPAIPFDVLDRIVGFVQDDYHRDFAVEPRDFAALRALRLTSKAFSDTATAHLFGTVTWSTHPEDWARLHNIAHSPRLAGFVTRLRYRDWHCGPTRGEHRYVAGFRGRYHMLFGAGTPNPISEDAVRRGYVLHRRRSQAQRDLVLSDEAYVQNIADMKRIIGYVRQLPRLRTITVSSKPILSPWLGDHVRYIKMGLNNIAAVYGAGEADEAIECFPKLVGRFGTRNRRDTVTFSWLILRMLKIVLGVVNCPYLADRKIAIEGDLFDHQFRIRDLTDQLIDDSMDARALKTLDLQVLVDTPLDFAVLHSGMIELWLKQFRNIQRFKFHSSLNDSLFASTGIVHVRTPMFGRPDLRFLRHLTIWGNVLCGIENLLSLLGESAKTLRVLEIDNLAHYDRGQVTFPPTPEPDEDFDDLDGVENGLLVDPQAMADALVAAEPTEPQSDDESPDDEQYPRSPIQFSPASEVDDDDAWIPGQYRGWEHCDRLIRDIAAVGLELELLIVFPENYLRYRWIESVRPPPRDALGYMVDGMAQVARFLSAQGGTRVEGSQQATIRVNGWDIRVHQPRRFPAFILG